MPRETPEQRERRHAQRVRIERAFAMDMAPDVARETLAETIGAIYCALDDIDAVPERLHPADVVSKHLQRGNMSGDDCDVVPRQRPRETPEDRSKPPEGFSVESGDGPDWWHSYVHCDIHGEQFGDDRDMSAPRWWEAGQRAAIAAAWAFVDRIRQEAAAVERERHGLCEAAVREAMRYLVNGGIGIRGVFNLLHNSLPESRRGDVMEVIDRVANGAPLRAEDDVRQEAEAAERERLARMLDDMSVYDPRDPRFCRDLMNDDGTTTDVYDPEKLAAWLRAGGKGEP